MISLDRLPLPATLRGLAVSPRYAALYTAWILTMISLPIVKALGGDLALRRGIAVSVLLQVAVVLVTLNRRWGWRRTGGMAVLVAALAWGVEALGSATGFPFGAYQYTDRLQPQLAHVPLLIPLAWLMMLPPAWAIGAAIRRRPAAGWAGRLALAGLSAVAFTAWDLFLDPQMVGWDLWRWATPGGYFGIPWSNYAGWLGVAFVVTLIARPNRLPERPLALIYAITWLLQSIGLGLFWQMPGPALAGFAGMGLMVGLAWRGAFGRSPFAWAIPVRDR